MMNTAQKLEAVCQLYVTSGRPFAYIIFKALARKVVLKGNTSEQYPPPMLYTKKKAATEARNNIQKRPVDFFVVSMLFFLQI